jgi:hypothetical protein
VYLWGAKHMSRMIRGPSRGSEALYENVEEFVRVYPPSTDPLPDRAFRVLPGYLSPATQSYSQSCRQTPDPNPVGNQPSSEVPPTASLTQEGKSPTASPRASEAPSMESDRMNNGKTPRSPQSPVLDSLSPHNPLILSSPFQPIADSP